MDGVSSRPGRSQENQWWLCTVRNVVRTSACWVALIFTLIASLVVTRSILMEYPFKEEDYVFHYPFNSIFDPNQAQCHSIQCENCEVFGSHEDLDDYVEKRYVTTDIHFESENNYLSVFNKTFNGSDYSCVKFEVREGENYVVNLTTTAQHSNFVLHYEGADKSYVHSVEEGKPHSLNFSGDENDYLHVCLRTQDDETSVSSSFSSEIVVLNGQAKVHNCTPICEGYENYFIQPNHGISMVYYSEYLPNYSIILLGFVPFILIFLASIVFCFRLTVGYAAYICLGKAGRGRGQYQDLRMLTADEDDFNPTQTRL